MKAFLGREEVQCVAVCDLEKKHLAEAKSIVDLKYGNSDCAGYTDFCDRAPHFE